MTGRRLAWVIAAVAWGCAPGPRGASGPTPTASIAPASPGDLLPGGHHLELAPRETGRIQTADVTLDGRRFAVVGEIGGLRVCDAASAICDEPIAVDVRNVATEPIHFDATGETIAVPERDRVRLVDARTGATRATKPRGVLHPSPDRTRLLLDTSDAELVLDARTGDVVATLPAANGGTAIGWSAGGTSVFRATAEQRVAVFDAATGRPRGSFAAREGVGALAVGDHDGTLVIVDAHRGATAWDIAGRHLRWMMKLDAGDPIAWSADGRTLAFARERSRAVVLVDADRGRVTATIDGGGRYLTELAFTSDGRELAFVGGTGGLESGAIDLATHAVRTDPVHMQMRRVGPWTLALRAHWLGVVVGGAVGAPPIVDFPAFRPEAVRPEAAAWGPLDRTFATIGGDRTVRIFDAHTGALLRVVEPSTDDDARTPRIAYAPDESAIAAVDGVELHVVGVDGRARFTVPFPAPPNALAFSPDGRLVAVAARPGILVYDAADGATVGSAKAEDLAAITFTAAGELVGVDRAGVAFAVDPRTHGGPQHPIATPGPDARATSPDGAFRLATDDALRVERVADGASVHLRFQPHGSKLVGYAASDAGAFDLPESIRGDARVVGPDAPDRPDVTAFLRPGLFARLRSGAAMPVATKPGG